MDGWKLSLGLSDATTWLPFDVQVCLYCVWSSNQRNARSNQQGVTSRHVTFEGVEIEISPRLTLTLSNARLRNQEPFWHESQGADSCDSKDSRDSDLFSERSVDLTSIWHQSEHSKHAANTQHTTQHHSVGSLMLKKFQRLGQWDTEERGYGWP